MNLGPVLMLSAESYNNYINNLQTEVKKFTIIKIIIRVRIS